MGWKWDQNGRLLLPERNLARDNLIFVDPRKTSMNLERGVIFRDNSLETGFGLLDASKWQWPGDDRVFLVPIDIIDDIGRLHGILRDVVVAVGQLYRENGYPADLLVAHTSYRKIAKILCLSFNGRVAEDIEKCLRLGAYYTVKNFKIFTLNKKGKVDTCDVVDFNFFSEISRKTVVNGKQVPKYHVRISVHLSPTYARILKDIPPAPLPVKALEAAHNAPARLREGVKNLAYYIAGKVPNSTPRILLPKFDQLGLKSPSNIEKALSILSPSMIRDFAFSNNGYNILLNGKKVKD